MTNAETNDKAATVAEQGAHVAPEKAAIGAIKKTKRAAADAFRVRLFPAAE